MARGWRVIKGGKDGEGGGEGEGSGEGEGGGTNNYIPYPEPGLVKPPHIDALYWHNMTLTERMAASEAWDDFIRNNS